MTGPRPLNEVHPGAIAWRTNPSNHLAGHPYHGHAALMRRAGGGVELIVVATDEPGHATVRCVMPAEDAERLRQVLGGEDDPVQDLVVRLLQDSHERTNHVTNQLLEAYKRERDEARAQLWALREELGILFEKGLMPTPETIMRIVHRPNGTFVQQYLEGEEQTS